MILVPAGFYTSCKTGSMGTTLIPVKKDGRVTAALGSMPFGTFYCPGFLIDETEVSNRDYLYYVRSKKALPPESWTGHTPLNTQLDLPAKVTLSEAQRYVSWAGLALPDLFEFSVATSDEANRFPFSMDHLHNISELGTHEPGPVGSDKQDTTPLGVKDLLGNAIEWTSLNASGFQATFNLLQLGSAATETNPLVMIVTPYLSGTNAYGFRCINNVLIVLNAMGQGRHLGTDKLDSPATSDTSKVKIRNATGRHLTLRTSNLMEFELPPGASTEKQLPKGAYVLYFFDKEQKNQLARIWRLFVQADSFGNEWTITPDSGADAHLNPSASTEEPNLPAHK
jgi:hypothetical protein